MVDRLARTADVEAGRHITWTPNIVESNEVTSKNITGLSVTAIHVFCSLANSLISLALWLKSVHTGWFPCLQFNGLKEPHETRGYKEAHGPSRGDSKRIPKQRIWRNETLFCNPWYVLLLGTISSLSSCNETLRRNILYVPLSHIHISRTKYFNTPIIYSYSSGIVNKGRRLPRYVKIADEAHVKAHAK